MELVHLLKGLSRYHDQESAWALPDRLEPPAQTKGSGNAGHLQPMPPERRPSLVPSLDSSYSSSSNTNGSFSPQAGAGPHASSTTGTPLTPTLSNGQQSQSPSDISGASKSATSLVNRGRSYSDAGTNASSDVGSASYRSVPSLANRESTRRHAVLLEASNLVLETPIERLATQITKLAWDIFSRMMVSSLRMWTWPGSPFICSAMYSPAYSRETCCATSWHHATRRTRVPLPSATRPTRFRKRSVSATCLPIGEYRRSEQGLPVPRALTMFFGYQDGLARHGAE